MFFGNHTAAMNPKTKATLFLLGLIAPLWILVLGFIFRPTVPGKPVLAMWLAWFILIYLLTSMTVAAIVTPRFFRNVPPPPASPVNRALKGGAIVGSWYLVIIWSCLFVFGAYQTLVGKLPLERALPAGMILLAFIGLFLWNIRRMNSARNANSAPPQN